MSRRKTTSRPNAYPADETASPTALLLHPTAEQALAAVGRVADELAKLNASMDKLIKAKGDGVRPAVEALAEQLITFLDATTADPDLEEEVEGDSPDGSGTVDDEPSLGSLDRRVDQTKWSRPDYLPRGTWDIAADAELDEAEREGDELDTKEASELEIYGEGDGDTGGIVDDEPSLGSLDGRMSQLRWSLPDRFHWWANNDGELDEAAQEVGIEDLPHDPEQWW
jgi:hypothetical protein